MGSCSSQGPSCLLGPAWRQLAKAGLWEIGSESRRSIILTLFLVLFYVFAASFIATMFLLPVLFPPCHSPAQHLSGFHPPSSLDAQACQAVPPIFTRSMMGISGPIIACYFPNLGPKS